MDNRPSIIWLNGVKPQVGDVATSKVVGRSGRALHIWEACPECGKERWIKRNTSGNLCRSCAVRRHAMGANNCRWNPTRKVVTKSGIRVYIDEKHPLFCMAHHCAQGWAILEHRLVMAQILGRLLKVGEVVHHLDGDNTNNKPENLILLPSQALHSSYTLLQIEVKKLHKSLREAMNRITVLEGEVVLLQSQIGDARQGNPELNGGNDASKMRRDYMPSAPLGQRDSPPLREI